MNQADAIASFDSTTISYTYDNGTVLAAIPVENSDTTEIISGTITSPRTTTTKDSTP